MKILITGATGFVGLPLTKHLQQQGYPVVVAVRQISHVIPLAIQQFPIGELLPGTDWEPALNDVDTIIHLAARVHVMKDKATNPLEEFRKVNTYSTINLAQQAASAGVKRFIFISSIKVNGEISQEGQPFTSDDTFIPNDPYGLSKYEAEQGLFKIAEQTSMQVVVIRPSLIYGPGVKANFKSMLQWLSKPIPLPLGAIHNKRSFVALDNLLSLITTCIDHPAAANQIFMVSDGEDISTSELLRYLSNALGQSPKLIPVPQKFLEKVLKVLGKDSIVQRLCGNLQVDIQKNKDILNWEPPISLREGLRRTVEKSKTN